MNKIIVTLILSLAFVGAVDARPSSSSSHSSSSSSHSSSSSSSRGISLAKPAAPAAKSPSISLAKPAAPAKSTSTTSTVVHEYHYYGGNRYGHGYYGGYRGGFGSSPFFWLWLLDRPQAVIVNGQPVQNGASGTYTATPSGGEMFLNFMLGALMFVGITVLIFWLARKFFRKK